MAWYDRFLARFPRNSVSKTVLKYSAADLLDRMVLVEGGKFKTPQRSNTWLNSYYDGVLQEYTGGTDYRFDPNHLAELYGAGLTAWACMNYNARQVSSVGMVVIDQNGELVMDSPIEYWLQNSKKVIHFTEISLQLWGSAYLVKSRNVHGYPYILKWVNNLLVSVQMTPDKKSIAYYMIDNVRYSPNDVIAIHRFDPLNEFGGLSEFEMAMRSVQTENNILDFSRAFFGNSARPDGMLIYEGNISPEEIEKARDDWKQFQGSGNQFKTFVSSNSSGKWTWQQITANIPDLALRDTRNSAIIGTCQAFGVTPALIGAGTVSDPLSAQNTLKQARINHLLDRVEPEADMICEVLSEEWLSEFEHGFTKYTLIPDPKGILAETKFTSDRWSLVQGMLSQGVLTADEARRYVGLDAMPSLIQINPQNYLTLWDKGIIPFGELCRAIGREIPEDEKVYEGLRIWDFDPSRKQKPPLTLSTRADRGDGSVILGLGDNPEIKKVVRLLKKKFPDLTFEDPASWYVTLLYLPKVQGDMGEFGLYVGDMGYDNFELTVTGLGSFETPDGYTVHLEVELTSDLASFQKDLVTLADDFSFEVSEYSRQYHPHITLGYTPNKPELPDLKNEIKLIPVSIVVSHEVGDKWVTDKNFAQWTIRNQELDEWSAKVREYGYQVTFLPKDLDPETSDWIKLQLSQGWNPDVVFETARTALQTGKQPLPLGATRAEYNQYWSSFDEMESLVGQDFLAYMEEISPEIIQAVERLFDFSLTETEAETFTLPVTISDKQQLVNTWVGNGANLGSLSNLVLAGASTAQAIVDTQRAVMMDTNWQLVATEAVKVAQDHALSLINDLDTTTEQRIRDLIVQSIREGWAKDELMGKVHDELVFGGVAGTNLLDRAENIAQTESVMAYNLGAFDRWEKAGVTQASWQTVRDERVCFPANAPITTDNGLVPISEIKVGDKVLTRLGYKSVVALSKRLYSGKMVRLITTGQDIVSTANHPIWVDGRDWVEAENVKVGDFLQTADNQLVKVVRVVNFIFSDSQNYPMFALQKIIFLLVSFWSFVPIISVNLNDYVRIPYEKINGVASYFEFLMKWNVHVFKRQPNFSFNASLPSKLAITTDTAKSSEVAWYNTKIFPTVFTRDNMWWSPARFRTVPSWKTFIARESLTTTPANEFWFLVFLLTFVTTMSIPFFVTLWDGKNLSALLTGFTDHLFFSALVVASLTTELFQSIKSGYISIKLLSAMFTLSGFTLLVAFMITIRTTKDSLSSFNLVGFFHNSFSAKVTSRFNHIVDLSFWTYYIWKREMFVYNLEVADKPEYYAYGFLVHNCKVCNSLHGVVGDLNVGWVSPLNGQTYYEIAHPRCRCFRRPVVS